MSDFMATVKRAAARRSIHDSAHPFNSTTDGHKSRRAERKTVDEVKTIISRLREELVKPFAIWCFAGTNKEEMSRLTWGVPRSALTSSYIRISKEVGRKTGTRSIPLEDNLRRWIVNSVKKPTTPSSRGRSPTVFNQ
jgi:hypothetical protein